MPSSFCRYEKNEECTLLKKPCVPGQKGCVITGTGYKIAEFVSKYGRQKPKDKK
jgi:hypothetical protein